MSGRDGRVGSNRLAVKGSMREDSTSPAPGRLVSVNVSSGGVPKRPVLTAQITAEGLVGDGHRYRLHGGPERAVVLYAFERIEALRTEGHPVSIGSLGENITVAGLDWDLIVPGVRLRTGNVVLEVTQYATPCRTIAHCFLEGDRERVDAVRHPGWSRACARVLSAGTVTPGDEVVILDAGSPT